MGTVEDIEQHAAARGLDGRARSTWTPSSAAAAREEYVDWVKRLLGLEPGGPIDVDRRRRTSRSQVADSPVRAGGRPRDASSATATARAWPPATAGRGATRGRTAPWSPTSRSATGAGRGTSRATASVGGAPPAALWATDPAGFGQVGCVYTAQGFEYDYAGVILGPDLVWRDGPLGRRARGQQGPRLPQPDQGQRRRTSTAWSATSTRCCSPAGCERDHLLHRPGDPRLPESPHQSLTPASRPDHARHWHLRTDRLPRICLPELTSDRHAMTSWVITIDKDHPQHWGIAKQHPVLGHDEALPRRARRHHLLLAGRWLHGGAMPRHRVRLPDRQRAADALARWRTANLSRTRGPSSSVRAAKESAQME